KLKADLLAPHHMGVCDDGAVARPDHSGTAAVAPGVDDNRRAAEFLSDFAESRDSHLIRLRADVPRPRFSLPERSRHARISAGVICRSRLRQDETECLPIESQVDQLLRLEYRR